MPRPTNFCWLVGLTNQPLWLVGHQRQLSSSAAASIVLQPASWPQERNLGHEESLHQIFGEATAAGTPGAADSFEKSLKAVASHGAQMGKEITEGRAVTQSTPSHVSKRGMRPTRQRSRLGRLP